MKKIAQTPTSEDLSDLPDLPATVITKDRQMLSTAGDVWRLRANADGGGWVDIDFRPMRRFGTARFVAITQLFVARKATTSAAWSLRNIAQAVSRAGKFWSATGSDCVDWSDAGLGECQALLTHGLKNAGVAGNDFAHIRALYGWGAYVAGLSDFDVQVAVVLKGIKAPGNLKGQRVLSGDADNGPFIAEEILAVDDAIKSGKGDPRDLVIAQLLAELGLRPIQIVRTRWSGLKRYQANSLESGIPRQLVRYTLDIPRAKERGEYRIEETRPISTLLGSRLEELRPESFDLLTPLCWWLGEDASAADIAVAVQRWVTDAELISPLTRCSLKANPTRFRYTLATEAARDGASQIQIAYLLFQTDLQNVEVYIDAAGSVMDQIEGKLNSAFGSDIDHFLGKIVSAHDPEPFEGLEKRVVPGTFPQLPEAPVLSLGLGACGQNIQRLGFCKLAPPITCYCCPKFAAFREVDHKSIGDALEGMARTRFGGQADSRIGGELVKTVQAIRELEKQIAAEEGLGP